MPSSGCQGSSYPNEKVRYLEHVQIIITLTAQRRGDLEIYLTSPSGTRSVMLARRPRDDSSDGFNNWTFMTTHCWGENPVGTWKLEIKNTYSICEFKVHVFILRLLAVANGNVLDCGFMFSK